MEQLQELGFDQWFERHIDADQTAVHEIARVISVHKDSFVISKGATGVWAECSGNLLFTANSPEELPTTGDWVYADFYDEDSHAIIHHVLPRKTVLKRKSAGKQIDVQLIGANIDVALIMQSLDENFNLRRLERYLAMTGEGGIEPIIVLSKCDLVTPEASADMQREIADIAPHVSILPFSNVTGQNINSIQDSLLPGKTYCLVGSSGVGKTTLINRLVGAEQFRTTEVSRKKHKGKHTTTSRELVLLDNGALLLDTPGMRELGALAIDSGIADTFPEIAALAETCRFRDCSHTVEAGCSVLAALKSGNLDEKRFKNYSKLKNESAFFELSYIEKKKKDKAFGKMVKSVMQHKKKQR